MDLEINLNRIKYLVMRELESLIFVYYFMKEEKLFMWNVNRNYEL